MSWPKSMVEAIKENQGRCLRNISHVATTYLTSHLNVHFGNKVYNGSLYEPSVCSDVLMTSF